MRTRTFGWTALREASSWKILPKLERCRILQEKWREAAESIESALSEVRINLSRAHPLHEQVTWLRENTRPLRAAIRETRRPQKATRNLPQIRSKQDEGTAAIPRAYQVAKSFLGATGFAFDKNSLSAYVAALQEHDSLELGEIWALRGMLQLVLIEEIGRAAHLLVQALADADIRPETPERIRLPQLISSLRRVSEAEWKDVVEQLSLTERVLREDPSTTYLRMDYEGRNVYRGIVQDLARCSDVKELDIARKAIDLARSAQLEWSSDTRVWERRSHVGYYLVDRGRRLLESRINYRPLLLQQISQAILDWPEVFYLVGIELLTLAAIAFILSGLGVTVPLIPALLLLLLPATEAGMGVMNRLVAIFLPPRPLPKLDLSSGIPPDCTTMVAVPTLLMNEQQVRQLVRDLEDALSCQPECESALCPAYRSARLSGAFRCKGHSGGVVLKLIQELNDRYSAEGKGSFFHFHRHRVYNPSEGAWMGWERKRGKLLDFNNLLRGKYDCFPIKAGDLSILPGVRYVITLDSDTELPRESAHRLIGTMAHPLNRAVIDPATNTVVEGYGVFQPRVGISVRSASRSRLASIYSGQTGFDIYTRAVSNVYQDVFGEGSFTGKGIYEVDVFQQVMAERFPANAILSHHLIEGRLRTGGAGLRRRSDGWLSLPLQRLYPAEIIDGCAATGRSSLAVLIRAGLPWQQSSQSARGDIDVGRSWITYVAA